MSVVSVEPINNRSSSIDSEFARTYEIVYRVVTNNKLDGPYRARIAVPYVIGQSYAFGDEFDTQAYCVDISADEDGNSGKVWTVTCTFGRARQLEESPFQQPWQIQYNGQNVEEAYNIDVNGRPVLNTAGDLFTTQLKRQASQPTLSITRNEPTVNPLALMMNNCVNADYFQGGPPGTVLCSTPSISSAFSQTYGTYFVHTYNFVYKMDGWRDQTLNTGFRKRNQRGVMQNLLVQGTIPSEPLLLNPSGTDVLPQGYTPVVLSFQPYNRAPFSLLGLS